MDTKRNIRRGNQNEPLIMRTTQLRITGGDHLVETGFVTRGLVSVRMDIRRNVGVEDREWRTVDRIGA